MVEVFRTDVKTKRQAKKAINRMRKTISSCSVNFDLDDCDKILRVSCNTEVFEASYLINILADMGINAVVLPDEQLHTREEVSTVSSCITS